MNSQQAVDNLEPGKWANTSISERLNLLKTVRENLKTYGESLARSDAEMKNTLMGENIYGIAESKLGTVVPIANTLTAAIDLYESLEKGEILKPIRIEKVADDEYRVQVFPHSAKERIWASTQKAYLYIKGNPRQLSPMDKPAGIIAVLGAGNYSSSLEMVKAMFFDNKAVVHKPHHLNEATDKIWEKTFQPLVDVGAVSFCAADQGRELTQDPRLTKIYFTGGTGTAKVIMDATDTPLVSECGGNNPCLIVPGDRPWTEQEIEHQAIQIATISKLNGGAVCGRPQTIITSKSWPQREQFMNALRKAIRLDTPASGTYYPGSDQVWDDFAAAYPNAEVIEPENGKYKHGKYMVITDVATDSYAVKNEAFCQIIDEVSLNVSANATAYLPVAVEFCNTQLLGTLGACILMDEDTKNAHQTALDQAVLDMNYGGIAINTMPPFVFLSPYLTWGGNEQREGQPFVSGYGNFGNLLCFENIEKSVLVDAFMSSGHMMNTSKAKTEIFFNDMARFAVSPSWLNLIRLVGGTIVSGSKKKDF